MLLWAGNTEPGEDGSEFLAGRVLEGAVLLTERWLCDHSSWLERIAPAGCFGRITP